jgi:hypothetical protein
VKEPIGFKRQEFKPNDDITLTISPNHLLTYPYPKEGLTKELALE